MKIIYGGHYQSTPDGWESIDYEKQDITQRLNHNDNSIDVIFTEHIFEHLPFEGAIRFLKEALRVLKEGGILRTVCPTIDKLIQFKNDDLGKHYADVQLKHYYPEHDAALRELGLDGVREEPIAFMMDSLLKKHNHLFVWTSSLIKKVLQKVGYKDVSICEPGESCFDNSNCLERTIRGANPDFVYAAGLKTFDVESMVIEAKK